MLNILRKRTNVSNAVLFSILILAIFGLIGVPGFITLVIAIAFVAWYVIASMKADKEQGINGKPVKDYLI